MPCYSDIHPPPTINMLIFLTLCYLLSIHLMYLDQLQVGNPDHLIQANMLKNKL